LKTLHCILTVALLTACSVSPADGDKLKAMIVSGQMNQYHNADTMDRVLRDYLEGSGRFDVTVVRTPARGEDMSGFAPDFRAYDVVVLKYDGDEWPQATKLAFENYVQSGGGLVSVHSSDNAFPHWQAFLEMTALGGWNGRDESWGPAVRWVDDGIALYTGPGTTFHPPPHDYRVTIRDPGHPITAGLPAEWLHAHDELYSMLRGPASKLHVLATGFADPSAENASGFHEPVLFTVRYGQGRIFHTTLGHVAADQQQAPESVRCVGFAVTLQRGTEWAASGQVTLALPANLPGPSEKLLNEPPG
jgi:type 1 glutamine amidotransferase